MTLAAERAGARLVATDVSAAALELAARNAHRHAVGEAVAFIASSWADGVDETFDLVVSNPPYVTSSELESADRDVRDYEPALALHGGADGLDAYRALLTSVIGRIRSGGALLLEVDPRRAAAVTDLVRSALPVASCDVVSDLAGRQRVVIAQLG